MTKHLRSCTSLGIEDSSVATESLIQKSKYFFMKASFQHQYLFFVHAQLVTRIEVAKQLPMAFAKRKTIFPVAMRLRDTPVPIPNTMVKT